MTIWSTIPIKLSLKSLKNSVFRKFRPTFDILEWLRSVQVVSKPPILVEWRGGVWLWPEDRYIKMNSLSNFWERHFRCLQKFAVFLNSHLSIEVKHLPFIPLKFGLQTPLEHFLIILKFQNWAKTPYQTMSFWEPSRITLIYHMAFWYLSSTQALLYTTQI